MLARMPGPEPGSPWIPYTIKVALGNSALSLPIVAKVRPSAVFFEEPNAGPATCFNCKGALSIIARDIVMQGWLIESIGGTGNDHQIEDVHYNLVPDPEFIARTYHSVGPLPGALGSAFLPGNPQHADRDKPDPAKKVPFVDIGPDGVSRGVTLNSFLLPGNIEFNETKDHRYDRPVIPLNSMVGGSQVPKATNLMIGTSRIESHFVGQHPKDGSRTDQSPLASSFRMMALTGHSTLVIQTELAI